MPHLQVEPSTSIFYRYDDFTDPWREAEVAVLLHGHAECSLAWNAWVPHLGRRYKVLRPDMRGWGSSAAIDADFPLTLEILSSDLEKLADALGILQFHLVGAKIGGTVAMHFAATRTKRVSTLTVLGAPVSGQSMGALAGADPGRSTQTLAFIQQHGIEQWIRTTMPSRLGSGKPQTMQDYWADYMARGALSSQLALVKALPTLDASHLIERIKCPTLVIASNTKNFSRDSKRIAEWQRRIERSQLVVIDDDGFHVAVSAADEAAEVTLRFMQSHDRSDFAR
jgi:3-oxoadipate enol-lactonase